MKKELEYPVSIPDVYYWMSGGNKKLFVGYVKGYIDKSYPKLKPLRIEGKNVICIRRLEDEKR